MVGSIFVHPVESSYTCWNKINEGHSGTPLRVDSIENTLITSFAFESKFRFPKLRSSF